MKRSIAFFVATVLVSMPVTKVYAYWNDKLNVDFTAMFVYPTQILVEKSGEGNGAEPLFEQKQFNQQTPVDMEQEAINHDTIPEVSES